MLVPNPRTQSHFGFIDDKFHALTQETCDPEGELKQCDWNQFWFELCLTDCMFLLN